MIQRRARNAHVKSKPKPKPAPVQVVPVRSRSGNDIRVKKLFGELARPGNMEILQNKFKGETVHVWGGGASLYGFDIHKLPAERTIVTNQAIIDFVRAGIQPGLYVFQDESTLPDIKRYLGTDWYLKDQKFYPGYFFHHSGHQQNFVKLRHPLEYLPLLFGYLTHQDR